MQRSAKDILAGLAFVAFGLAFALGALTYEVGSPLRMGPGFFPLVVGALLAGLGSLIALRRIDPEEADDAPLTMPAWRPVLLILAALVFFALTIRGLGLIPTVFATAILAIVASRRASIVATLLVAAGLTFVSVLIFGIALNLRLPLLGPWIPRI